MKKRLLSLILAGLACALFGMGSLAAQDEPYLWLGQPDLSDFPLVRLPLRTADAQGNPITDLSRLSLRENGIPLEIELVSAPAGLDLIFVVDANADFHAVDDNNSLSRREKVAASVNRFAGRFMDDGGADQVTVIVPDEGGANGRILIQASTADPLAQAVTAYNPDSPPAETPLNEMMALALEQASPPTDGRLPVIFLFTDGGRLHQQLVYAELLAQAQVQGVAIYAAVLGARVDPNEIDNVTRLTAPTGGGYVHLLTPEDSEPVFRAWQAQTNQLQITYRSLQTQSGRYPITVNLGSVRATSELNLTLAAPVVTLQPTETKITRTGPAFDTPLAALEPNNVVLPVQISWPDQIPRALTAVALVVSGPDGQTNTIVEAQPDADGRLALDWDVQFLREGAYQMLAQVADNLGYTAESEPVVVTLRIQRPDLPTPTPLPPPTPAVLAPSPRFSTVQLGLALGLSLLAGLIAAVLLWRRWRRRRIHPEPETGFEPETAVPAPEPSPSPFPPAAALERGDADGFRRLPLIGANVTIGRDGTAARLILDDKSVARLHARIRWRDGRYWLYDEGSASGVYLNFERLGLAPRPLQDGDQIQIGQLRLSFRLGVVFDEEE